MVYQAECFEAVPPLSLLTYPPYSTYPSLLALFPLPGKCLTSHQCIRMVTLSWSQTTVQYLSFLFHPNFLYNKLMNHLLSNSIISRQQFGFRPQSSTQEALLAATNDWHQYLDSNLSVGCVAFDLSKAFDSLPHPTILSNLSRVGIRGRLLDWFQNYLSNRQQKVVLDGHESSTAHVASGVPQGLLIFY